MNKKILGVFVSLLAIVILATPVMAAPAERIPVTLISVPGPVGDPEWQKLTKSNIWQARGREWTVDFTILIPDEAPLVGVSYNVINTRYFGNKLDLDYDKDIDVTTATWVISEGNTFEGMIKVTWYNLFTSTPIEVKWSAVMHGTGIYRGQTLKFTYEGPVAGLFVMDGVLIRPQG